MRSLLISVLAFVIMTPTASADVFTDAEAWWGRSPTQCESVDAQMVDPARLQEDARGEATQPEPGEYGPCVYYLSDRLMPCELKSVARHEFGHLLGLGHSKNPESIMHSPSPDWWCRSDQIKRELVGIRHQQSAERRLCKGGWRSAMCRRDWRLLSGERRWLSVELRRLLALELG